MNKKQLETIIKEEIDNLMQEGPFRKLITKIFSKKVIKPQQIKFPDWLVKKVKSVHGTPGQGSVFSKSVIEELPDLVKMQASKKSDEILKHFKNSKDPYVLSIQKPGAGYDFVLRGNPRYGFSTPNGKGISGSKSVTNKVEGGKNVRVLKWDFEYGPYSKMNKNISMKDFETDKITALIVPSKNMETGKLIKGEYTVITAFPGRSAPRASDWGDKFAIASPKRAEMSYSEKRRYDDEARLYGNWLSKQSSKK